MMIENTGGEQTVLNVAKADIDSTFDRQMLKGMEKYKVVLKTFNGRDAGKDAYEELIDLAVYLEQLRMEHRAFAEILYWATETKGLKMPEKILETLKRMNGNADLHTIQRKWELR